MGAILDFRTQMQTRRNRQTKNNPLLAVHRKRSNGRKTVVIKTHKKQQKKTLNGAGNPDPDILKQNDCAVGASFFFFRPYLKMFV